MWNNFNPSMDKQLCPGGGGGGGGGGGENCLYIPNLQGAGCEVWEWILFSPHASLGVWILIDAAIKVSLC